MIFVFTLLAWRFFELENIKIPYRIWAFAIGWAFLNLFVLFPFYIFRKFYKKDFPIFLQIFVWICLISINIFGLYNAFSPKIVEYSIKTEKETILKWEKIILIADTHYWNIFSESEAEKLVKKLNSIDAKFVLIAWDFFDWPKINFENIWKIFKKLNKPVFFAPWNHEEYWDFSAMISAINSDFFFILNNGKISKQNTEIFWVNFSDSKDEENFENILKSLEIDKNKFNILIKHEPKNLEIAFKNNFDLIVSGHTHRWQMWPISLIPEKIYGKYVYWVNEENGSFAITTSWVWGWWPPQRFGTRSEIVVIEIK